MMTKTILPYDQIALFYDKLMAHVAYDAWADYIEMLFDLTQTDIHTVLECGCGTGSFLTELKKRGYAAAGYDLSHAMVAMARRKGLTETWQGDMQRPPTSINWDCVLSLYDTIHYLKEEALDGFFKASVQILRPGGVLIFDAVTLSLVREYWMDFTERDVIEPFEYVRHSYFESKHRCQHTEFQIRNIQTNQTVREHHQQWIYPIETYIRSAEAQGFHPVGIFDNCTMESANEDSDRVHIVLQREAA